MEVLYRGFDGLDFSLQGQIGPDLEKELKAAKAEAQRRHDSVMLDWNGIKLHVAETGAQGGYAYRANTGDFGATWFFKSPNGRDPWGIRVSCNSLLLATYGIGEAQNRLYKTLECLGVRIHKDGESIGRVDYAIDLLAPAFELIPNQFVMHSNSIRADYIEQSDMSVHGKSGRVTSVTVGKMPGRQVIIYDKRADVLAKGKVASWEIWNATRAHHGLVPLNSDNPQLSRVWRAEIRAGKKHLKDHWNIRSWRDLAERCGDMFAASACAIRHTDPGNDSNRSRWPDSSFWSQVRSELEGDLFEMRSFAEPNLVKDVHQEAHNQLLKTQTIGLLTTRAAICRVDANGLPRFVELAGIEMANEIENAPEFFAEKLRKAAARYSIYD